MIGAVAAARRRSSAGSGSGGGGSGSGGAAATFGLRWNGSGYVNGGMIVTDTGALAASLQSSGNTTFSALESLAFPVTGKWKFIVRIDYASLPYSLYFGVCDAALNITTFGNQAGNVDSVYTYAGNALSAFSVNGQSAGTLPASGPVIAGFDGDTSTGDWSYRDSLGNVHTGLKAAVGDAPGPLGIFCYVQGGPATFTIQQDDAGLSGFDPDAVNVAN